MSRTASGILLLLGFVAAVAVRDVWLGAAFGTLSLFEVASLAFGGAAVVFGGGLLLFRRTQLQLLCKQWRLVLLANLTTGVAWLSYFAALDRAPPSAVNLLFSAVAPVSVWLLAAVGWARPADAQATSGQRTLHLGLLAVAIGLTGTAWRGGLGGGAASGLALAGLAGLVITVESVVAKRMSETGLTAVAVVGVRFIGVALFANVMLLRQAQMFAGLPIAAVAWQALVLLAVLVSPILMAQAGLARSTPLISSVVLALGPVATLTLQWSVGIARLPPTLLVAVAAYTALALAAALMLARAGVAGNRRPGRSAG